MHESDHARRPNRARVVFAVLGGCLLSLVVGAVLVRLSLDRLDSQPYDGERTETAYIVVASLALLIWWGGSAVSVFLGWRVLRRSTPRNRR